MAKQAKLTRARIVDAASAMIDEAGAQAFSMRKLAAALEVDPMAVYHHLPNKSALLTAVMQAMLEGCAIPSAGADWRADLREICGNLRALAHRHPGAFRLFETWDDWLPGEHRIQEALLDCLARAGFAPVQAVRAARLLMSYTEAFAVDEIGGWLDPGDRTELEDSIARGPYPTLAAHLDAVMSPDPDADFAFGLRVILNGLEAERG